MIYVNKIRPRVDPYVVYKHFSRPFVVSKFWLLKALRYWSQRLLKISERKEEGVDPCLSGRPRKEVILSSPVIHPTDLPTAHLDKGYGEGGGETSSPSSIPNVFKYF